MTNYAGSLFSFEGIDGAGKTTLITALARRLRADGHDVIVTKEPGGTFIGTMLKQVLLEEKRSFDARVECLLFAADRAEHFQRLIVPALEAGSIVLSDRMHDSAIAYQGFGRGLSVSLLEEVNRFAMRGIAPDRTFYLRIQYEVACARRAARNEKASTIEQEQEGFWHRVSEGYEHLARTNSQRIVTLDGTAEAAMLVDEVYAQVATLVSSEAPIASQSPSV